MKTAWLSNFHSKHCPGPLKFPFGSIATREIEQNRQRTVLSQLPVGIQPEGLNMLLNMNYSLSPWYILSVCLYCTTADTLRTGNMTSPATGAATKLSWALFNTGGDAVEGTLQSFILNKYKLRLHSLSKTLYEVGLGNTTLLWWYEIVYCLTFWIYDRSVVFS